MANKLPEIFPVLTMPLPWYSNQYLKENGCMPAGIKTRQGTADCLVMVNAPNNDVFVDVDTYDEEHSEWSRYHGAVIMWTPFPVFDVEHITMVTQELKP